jgi:polysaccharide biosynthesis/export protein
VRNSVRATHRMYLNHFRFLAGATAALLCTGCAVVPGLHIEDLTPAAARTQKISGHEEIRYFDRQGPISALRIVTLTPESLVASAPQQQTSGSSLPVLKPDMINEYIVGPGDVINVIVWEHPELTNPTGEFRDPVSAGRLIDGQGMMYYPYVGTFKAAGMNVSQLRDFIAQRLSSVVSKPQVDARVVAFRSQRVQVSGEVRNPGQITLDDMPKGLLEALGERGGLTENASRRVVELNRNGQRHIIGLAALLSGSRIAPNPLLMPGDIIHVPERSVDQVFVLGEVNREGPVFLQQHRTTLTEILAAAGGLNRTGSDDTGVLVFRRPSADGVASLYRASLATAVGFLAAGEFALEPRDVVYVSSTGFSEYNSVINQLLPTISAIFQVDALVNR